MAITLDTIVNKAFNVVKNGYDNNEVEQFLDEILEEMENREAQTNALKEQVANLTSELERAKAALAAKSSAPVQVVPAVPVVEKPAVQDRHAAESFELVLTKAKGAYEEIVAAADARAEEIVQAANEEASGIRGNAEAKIADLTEKFSALRDQTSAYYASLKEIVEAQAASMEQLKKLL